MPGRPWLARGAWRVQYPGFCGVQKSKEKSERELAAVTSRQLRILAASILVLGLAGAIAIYIAAASSGAVSSSYDPEQSKQYLRTMELYGGKANVLAAELRAWFDALWHGTRLAYTVACASVFLASACWLGAAAAEG